MTIKIPVSADFNGDDVKKQIAQINAAIKQMGEAVAKANGEKFEPITLNGKEDLKYFIKQSEKLLKIQGELRQRMKHSGQEGKNPFLANWSHLYLNESTRLKRQQEALVFLGASFEERAAPPAPPVPSVKPPPVHPINRTETETQGAPKSLWAHEGTRILNAGAQAAGPMGSIVAGGFKTGASSGFGAGLLGMLGGFAALGVSQVVSGVIEKLDQAQQNDVDIDRLKRTLGDVNTSFEGLKALVEGNANGLGIVFDESIRLSSQFAKLANLTDTESRQLMPEIETGVGFSKSFGLDNQQTVETLGALRGLRVTRNDQDTRRMALLIGETIAKSDAFAKADEVMGAIGNFASLQTRMSLSRANVTGYTGTYSALVSSGIAGLDPAGVAGLLGRINSSLMAGGAKGEASQFFSSRVANRLGMDPIQMRIFREGGMFATPDQMFGGDSTAKRYGISGPRGDTTFIEATIDELRRAYGHNPGMLAMATSEHLGIGINPAMALLSVKPKQMGELQRGLADAGIDIRDVNSAGISNLAKVFTGTAEDRQAVANNLLGRTGNQALSGVEADRLRTAMASGDAEEQKKILAELVATRDQEATQGKDIRESKAILENIKTELAGKLTPAIQQMRHGVMAIAGVGKDGETSDSVIERVIRADYEKKAKDIEGEYEQLIKQQQDRHQAARVNSTAIPTEEEAKLPRDEMARAVNARMEAAKAEMEAANAEIDRLKAERDGKLRDNKRAADERVAQETRSGKQSSGDPAIKVPLDIKDPEERRNAQAFLHTIKTLEGADFDTVVGGGKFTDFSKHPNRIGVWTKDGPSTAAGAFQITNKTFNSLGRDKPPDFSRESQIAVAIALIKRRGAWDDVLKGRITAAAQKLGPEWQSLPTGVSKNQPKSSWSRYYRTFEEGRKIYAPKEPAQLPPGGAGISPAQVSVSVPPIEVVHKNEQGQTIAPTQTLQPVVSPARPFGMGG